MTAVASRGRSADGGEDDPLIVDRYTGVRAVFNPLWCYYGFISAVMSLTVFGLIMVFSSSSVDMVAQGVAPWSQVASQAMYCAMGLTAGFVAMHLPMVLYRRGSFILMLLSMALQLLTFTGLGVDVNGNTGWIRIGPLSMQPAEFIKLALCLWLPSAMAAARLDKARTGKLSVYAIPAGVFGLCLGLILLGKDLGTAMIIVMIGAVAFMVGGVPLRWLLGLGALGTAAIVVFFVMGSSNRMSRILATYGSCSQADAQAVCYQSIHGEYAIASGGLTGVGLGNSREKWSYLPEAHNDFIFAIIAEETGFIGAALVVIAFVVLGWCLICVALRSQDRYARVVLVCIAAWLVGQGLVNICVVLGILPVIGLPMPFVSAGGSALIMCLTAAGVAVRMMRGQPQISAARSVV